MHIGGFHVFAGLFFLVCCMVLTIGYAYGAYALFVAFRKFLRACNQIFNKTRDGLGEKGGMIDSMGGEENRLDNADPLRGISAILYLFMGGKGQKNEFVPLLPVSFLNKRFLLKASRIIVLLLLLVYVQQRTIWMGSDNTYYKAKEYFVAGQVVYAHRKVMEFFSILKIS